MNKVESERDMRTFKINIRDLRSLGVIDTSDLIANLQSLIKVKNSKVYAGKVVSYKNMETSIELTTGRGNIKKRDLSQYCKRVLRKNGLADYFKVQGGEVDEINFRFVDTVENAEEEEQ